MTNRTVIMSLKLNFVLFLMRVSEGLDGCLSSITGVHLSFPMNSTFFFFFFTAVSFCVSIFEFLDSEQNIQNAPCWRPKCSGSCHSIYNICPIAKASTIHSFSEEEENPLANRWCVNWKCFLVIKKESIAH